jgi:hypothetical protein
MELRNNLLLTWCQLGWNTDQDSVTDHILWHSFFILGHGRKKHLVPILDNILPLMPVNVNAFSEDSASESQWTEIFIESVLPRHPCRKEQQTFLVAGLAFAGTAAGFAVVRLAGTAVAGFVSFVVFIGLAVSAASGGFLRVRSSITIAGGAWNWCGCCGG